jgi:hypothetical protein
MLSSHAPIAEALIAHGPLLESSASIILKRSFDMRLSHQEVCHNFIAQPVHLRSYWQISRHVRSRRENVTICAAVSQVPELRTPSKVIKWALEDVLPTHYWKMLCAYRGIMCRSTIQKRPKQAFSQVYRV